MTDYISEYSSLLNSDFQIPSNIIYLLVSIILIFLIISLTLYLIKSFGLYKMAMNLNIENPWFSFIPVANLYLLGKVIKDFKIGKYEILEPQKTLPIITIVCTFFSLFPIIGILVSLIPALVYFFAVYKLFKIYKPDKAKMMIIVSAILPFMPAVYVFMLRNEAVKES